MAFVPDDFQVPLGLDLGWRRLRPLRGPGGGTSVPARCRIGEIPFVEMVEVVAGATLVGRVRPITRTTEV